MCRAEVLLLTGMNPTCSPPEVAEGGALIRKIGVALLEDGAREGEIITFELAQDEMKHTDYTPTCSSGFPVGPQYLVAW